MVDVTVTGAGVAGLWAALSLRRAGASVRLIDRHGAPGPHTCSWWAGGMLAPQCEGATAEPPIVEHGKQAADVWRSVTNVTHMGSLVVALERDRGELNRFARRTEGHRLMSQAELRQLEPEITTANEALFYASEAHLDPRNALSDLQQALIDEGVEIEVAEAEPETFSETVIDARGMASDVPGLRGVRGEMVVLHAPEIKLARPVRLLHPRHPLYIVPRGGGLYMLGATQIESASRGRTTARALLELLSAAYALDPRFAEAEVVETGADLRPAFADNIPRVTKLGRIFSLNGLFRHGYLMAPALAAQATAWLTQGIKGDLCHEA